MGNSTACTSVHFPGLWSRAPRNNKKDNPKRETRADMWPHQWLGAYNGYTGLMVHSRSCGKDLDKFGTNLKTVMEYVGRQMGWNMGLKRAGWVCPTSGIKRLRYGLWNERPACSTCWHHISERDLNCGTPTICKLRKQWKIKRSFICFLIFIFILLHVWTTLSIWLCQSWGIQMFCLQFQDVTFS